MKRIIRSFRSVVSVVVALNCCGSLDSRSSCHVGCLVACCSSHSRASCHVSCLRNLLNVVASVYWLLNSCIWGGISSNWNCSSVASCGVSSNWDGTRVAPSGISSLVGSSSGNFQWLFRVVNNLSFYWDVFVFFDFSLSGYILNCFFWNILRNVLSEILDCVVVGLGHFSWNLLNSLFLTIFNNFSGSRNSLDSGLIFVFEDLSFEWHVLDSALSLDDLSTCIDGSVDNLPSSDNSSSNASVVAISANIVVLSDNGGGIGVSVADIGSADQFSCQSIDDSGLGHDMFEYEWIKWIKWMIWINSN